MQVHIFSRNCEDKTPMFPDVANQILAASSGPADIQDDGQRRTSTSLRCSFIVDSELVAVDRAQGGKLRAFQDLSTRLVVLLCSAF